MDHKLYAFQLSSEANGERDIATGSNNDMGFEITQMVEAMDQGLDQTVREEEEVVRGDEGASQPHRGNRGEVVPCRGDCSAFHAVWGANEEELACRVGEFELICNGHRRVHVAAGAAGGEDHS